MRLRLLLIACFLFIRSNDTQQESYLLENLADLEDGTALRKSQDLIDAWNSADAAKIDASMRELTSGDSVSSRFMRHILLGKRNPEMANAIDNIMKDNKIAFVGVGLLHLLGAQGLPQLLRQRGYVVEKIY